MSAMTNTHAGFTVRNIDGMYEADCECGKSLHGYQQFVDLYDALNTHWDEALA